MHSGDDISYRFWRASASPSMHDSNRATLLTLCPSPFPRIRVCTAIAAFPDQDNPRHHPSSGSAAADEHPIRGALPG